MSYSIAVFESFIGIIADPLAVQERTRIGCWPNHTGQEAEQLADQLSGAGFHVYVIRYGCGNGCLSGTPGNGVKYIDVVRCPKQEEIR